MHGIWKAIGSFVRRADMVLLSLCIAASVFGIVVISSATNVKGSAQFVRTQTLALILGVILYVVFTLIDVDIIAERRELLLIFSAIFILLLFPFGDTRSGNRGIVNILNHIDANNNLILSIRVDYLDDAFMRFNCLGIGLRIVSQLET